MATLTRSMPPMTPEKGSGFGGPTHGVVTGKYFNFNPLPPPPDVLGNALIVPDLPTHKLPQENWKSRIHRMLAQFHIGSQSSETRMRWKIYDAIVSVMASVSPGGAAGMMKTAKTGQKIAAVTVRHPYHLRHIFDMVPQIPDTLAAERRFLELLLSRIVKKYGEQMSLAKNSPFSFEHECREYFHAAFKAERHIAKVTNPDERFGYLQAVYTNYFHGKNYYYYSLLRRERLEPDNKLFTFFCRAHFFIAQVDWDGALLDKPNPRSLPNRNQMMFYARRDKTVLTRYRSDPEYKAQMKDIVDAFPAG